MTASTAPATKDRDCDRSGSSCIATSLRTNACSRRRTRKRCALSCIHDDVRPAIDPPPPTLTGGGNASRHLILAAPLPVGGDVLPVPTVAGVAEHARAVAGQV